jgi:hypothetical protein
MGSLFFAFIYKTTILSITPYHMNNLEKTDKLLTLGAKRLLP